MEQVGSPALEPDLSRAAEGKLIIIDSSEALDYLNPGLAVDVDIHHHNQTELKIPIETQPVPATEDGDTRLKFLAFCSVVVEYPKNVMDEIANDTILKDLITREPPKGADPEIIRQHQMAKRARTNALAIQIICRQDG